MTWAFFPIFNKTWLSSTGKADICSYNSFSNAFAGWLVTSFNWAKYWEISLLNSSIFSFRLQQQCYGPLLYLCFNAFWFRHDTDTQDFYKMTVRDHVVTLWWQNHQQENVFFGLIHCLWAIQWMSFPREGKCFSPNPEVCNSCSACVMYLLYIVKVMC